MQRSILAVLFLGLLAADGTVVVGTTATTASKDTTIVGSTAAQLGVISQPVLDDSIDRLVPAK
ncbi:uncharacterized protein ACA1_261520 [Acanthamoeba castellanii str. Neff]|uniref:Uncharacterized protein n=1 Tax=Acanthamoeba castellanii (strain ATCC 30010 / Neff) TaxID=1257118 RepID=L8GFG2_ACACF|nr:uncharacterized protein ACA1_261520 [Acanthamoeba castellanii str. Neff]ELR11732.1 hypothetical protein ACA1_261520 [Acanthamoeba castellanii str. Neff]